MPLRQGRASVNRPVRRRVRFSEGLSPVCEAFSLRQTIGRAAIRPRHVRHACYGDDMTFSRLRLVSLISPLVPLMLAGCVSNKTYPSLSERPIERIGQSATPVVSSAPPPPEAPRPTANLTQRLADLVRYAQEADSRFQAQRPATERAINAARRASVNSDTWSSAQIALGELDSSRSGSISALADMDDLYSQARDKAPNAESPATQAITVARDTVQKLVSAQNAAFQELAGQLPT